MEACRHSDEALSSCGESSKDNTFADSTTACSSWCTAAQKYRSMLT